MWCHGPDSPNKSPQRLQQHNHADCKMKCSEQDASLHFSTCCVPVIPRNSTPSVSHWAQAASEVLSKSIRCILSCCKGTQAVGSPDGLRAMLFCKICEMLHSETQGGFPRVIKLALSSNLKEAQQEGELLRSLCKCVCVCVFVDSWHLRSDGF